VTVAYVGLGSNLGDSKAAVSSATKRLAAIPGTHLLKKSSLYRSAPVGYADQPDYVNAVAAIETSQRPLALLAELLGIEALHGRQRTFQNAPRTLDLDLLLYGDEIIDEESLTVPHPKMHERAFVLKPLLEIAPGIEIPGKGMAKDLLENCQDQRVERID